MGDFLHSSVDRMHQELTMVDYQMHNLYLSNINCTCTPYYELALKNLTSTKKPNLPTSQLSSLLVTKLIVECFMYHSGTNNVQYQSLIMQSPQLTSSPCMPNIHIHIILTCFLTVSREDLCVSSSRGMSIQTRGGDLA